MPPTPPTPLWQSHAQRIADTVLWPHAQETDQSPHLPLSNIQTLADAGLLGVNVPVSFGGSGGNMNDIAILFEILGSGCGVTLFVALQHMLACSYVDASANTLLRQTWLPSLATGKTFATVAYSQVRRPGPPVMRCTRVGTAVTGDSYVFTGVAPWSTGWGLASELILGGTLDDGVIVFALVPADAPGLSASPPMKMCAMNASATVSLTADSVKVGPERFIKKITRDDLAKTDFRGMFLTAHLSHSVTHGSLRHLNHLLHQRSSDALVGVIARIQTQLAQIKSDADAWLSRPDDPAFASNAIRLRAASICLSISAAQAAVMASAGTANALDHPAQRLFREAMLYSLTAQTRELQSAMLQDLLHPPGLR